MPKVGSLVVELAASVVKFQADLGKATAMAERSAKRMDSVLSSVGKTLGIGISVAGITAFVKSTIDSAAALSELSDRSGVSVKSLAGFQFAAQQTGSSTEDFAKALKFLNKNISESASGDAPALKKLFTDLGMKEAASGAIKAEEALLQLADVFPRLNEADKVRVGLNLLGKSGESLVPALAGGRAELESMIAAGQKLNPITQEQAKQADDFKDAVSRLGTALSTSVLPLLDKMLPLLESFADSTAKSSKEITVFSVVSSALGKIFETIVVLGSEVAFVFEGIGKEIGGMAAQIVALGSGDLKGFNAIGAAMKEDAKAAREAQDIFTSSILNADAKKKQRDEALALLGSDGIGNEGRSKALTTDKPAQIKLSAGAVKPASKGKSKGDSLIENLKEQVATFGKSEDAMLRYKANLEGVSAAAEPFIERLRQMKDAQQASIEKQEMQIDSTDNYLALLDERAMAESDALQTLQEFTKANEDKVSQLNFEASAIGKTAIEQEILTAHRMVDLEVMQKSIGLDDEKKKRLQELGEEMKAGIEIAIKNKDESVKAFDTMETAISRVSDAFGEFIKKGKFDFKDFVASILADTAKVQFKELFGNAAKSSSGSGGWGAVFAAVFGGGKAAGGPVSAGMLYAVNERGPELLSSGGKNYLMMGGQGGNVTPNNALGGGTFVTNIDARGADAGMLPRLQAMMEANNARLKSEILDSRRRNGAFA